MQLEGKYAKVEMNQSPRGSATMTDWRATLPGSDSADGDTEIGVQ